MAEQGKRAAPTRLCSRDDCDAVHFGHGLCRKHYLRAYIQPNPKQSARAVTLQCQNCGQPFLCPSFRKDVAKFCSRLCACRFNMTGKIIKKGYRKVLDKSHPRADSKGYVFEHIVVAEQMLGRPVLRGEEIHHRDENPLNNAPDNLEVCENHAVHMLKHGRRGRLSSDSHQVSGAPLNP